MITLKRLKAENFKGLRSVDLIFPQRGSVLIEGYNEAGKSTLFEAVYVALYGKPLVGEDRTARQEEVIQYGQSRSIVQLTFNVGPQELTIQRVFERGKSQQAMLTIQRPDIQDVQPEVINRVRAVDERILKELGNLDGESLRNSCFVEQKELGRIETLSFAQREQAIQKLLGLERLMKLIDQFKYRREQERDLRLAESFLKLARLQAEVHAALAQEAELAERMDAVRVAGQLEQLISLESQRVINEELLRECTLRIQEARKRLEDCSTLRKQLRHCDDASQRMVTVHHAYEALDRTQKELAQLERIAKVGLPEAYAYLDEVRKVALAIGLTEQARRSMHIADEAVRDALHQLQTFEQAISEQQRLTDELAQAQSRVVERQEDAAAKRRGFIQRLEELGCRENSLEQILALVRAWEAASSELQTIQQSITAAEGREQELFRLRDILQQQENDVRNKDIAVGQAKQEMQSATDAARLATGYEALTAWIRLKHVEMNISGYTDQESGVASRRREAEMALANARMKTHKPLFAGVVFAVLACLCIVFGIFWLPAIIFAAFCVVGDATAWIWFFQARKVVHQKAESLVQCNTDLQRLEMQRQAAIQAGGDPTTICQYEQQLQNAGIPIPSSPDTAYAQQEELRQKAGIMQGYLALQAIAQEARADHIRLTEQLSQARLAVDESKAALNRALQSGDPTAQLRSLNMRLAEQERFVAAAEQRAKVSSMAVADIEWPTNSNILQTFFVKCQAEIGATKEAQKQQELVATRLIRDAEADKAKVWNELLYVQQTVATLRMSNPAEILSKAQGNLTKAQMICRQQENALEPLLRSIRLKNESDVEPERGRAEAQVQALETQLATYPSKEEAWKQSKDSFADAFNAALTTIGNLLTALTLLSIRQLPTLPHASSDHNAFLLHEDALKSTLNKCRQALEAALIVLDEQETRNVLDQALNKQGTIEHEKRNLEREIKKRQQTIDEILLSRNIAYSSLTF